LKVPCQNVHELVDIGVLAGICVSPRPDPKHRQLRICTFSVLAAKLEFICNPKEAAQLLVQFPSEPDVPDGTLFGELWWPRSALTWWQGRLKTVTSIPAVRKDVLRLLKSTGITKKAKKGS
jgi:hypothetical protein